MAQKLTRRSFLRLTAGTAALGVGVSAIAACQPATAPSTTGTQPTATTAAATTQEGGGTLVYGYPQLTTYGNFCSPWHYAGTQDVYAYRLTYSGLLQWNNDFSGFINDLAESYEMSEDKLTCTFHLRQNVKWHDGEPFTAKDVVFTFHVIGHPNSLWTNYGELSSHIEGLTEYNALEAETISGITAPDDFTVVFKKLTPSVIPFLNLIAQQVMIPEHILGDIPTDNYKDGGLCQTDWALKSPVGTGPFRVIEYVPDQYITFERYEDYHRPKAKLDRLIYRAYTNAQAQSAALESGECHAGTIPAIDYERFSQMDHIRIVLNHGLSNAALFMNVTTVPQKVRQALWYAMDMESINQLQTQGIAPVPQVIFEYGNYGVSPNAKKYTYDPEMAKTLLAEAVAAGEWDMEKTLRWAVVEITPQSEPFFELVRSNWADVGVKMELLVVGADYGVVETDPTALDLLHSGQVWGADPSAAYTYFREPRYITWVDIPEAIEILDRISQTEDQEEIKQGVWRLQEIANESAHIIPYQRAVGIYAINKKVQGDLRPIYALWTRNDWKWEEIWVQES